MLPAAAPTRRIRAWRTNTWRRGRPWRWRLACLWRASRRRQTTATRTRARSPSTCSSSAPRSRSGSARTVLLPPPRQLTCSGVGLCYRLAPRDHHAAAGPIVGARRALVSAWPLNPRSSKASALRPVCGAANGGARRAQGGAARAKPPRAQAAPRKRSGRRCRACGLLGQLLLRSGGRAAARRCSSQLGDACAGSQRDSQLRWHLVRATPPVVIITLRPRCVPYPAALTRRCSHARAGYTAEPQFALDDVYDSFWSSTGGTVRALGLKRVTARRLERVTARRLRAG